MVKRLLKLHKYSLDVATNFLGIHGKNHILGLSWLKARVGDEEGLAYVLDHNKRDVVILEKLHDKLANYMKRTTKSI